jgi:hypothetical protein
MARPKSQDGRRVHVNIKLSEAEAAAIDAIRGNLERGPWMRQVALEAARRMLDSGIRERLGIGITVDDRQPPGVVGFVSRGRESTSVSAFSLGASEPGPGQDRKAAGKGPCEHRIPHGSFCTRCGRLI